MSGTRDVVTGAKNRILEMLSSRGQSKEDESAKLIEKGYSEERGVTLFYSCKKRLSIPRSPMLCTAKCSIRRRMRRGLCI